MEPTRIRQRSAWQQVGRIVAFIVLAYVGVVVLFAWFENSLLYFPTRYPEGDWTVAPFVEDAWFNSADGTRLHGWFTESSPTRAVVLFCHGNGGCIAHRQQLLHEFRQLSVSALLFDYRGYGRSEGSPNEAGVLADTRAARRWLATKTGIPEDKVVLWGESLGGAVAVDLAADGARGLILENTFSSLPEAAAYHYPWLPTRTCMRSRYNALSKIGRYRGPLLQFHGDADTIVPYALGRKLFDAANEPKTWVTVAGADHNVPRTEETFAAINKFLSQYH